MRAIDKNNKRMGMYPQMRGGKDLRIVFLGAARAIVLLCTMLLFSSQASALPSYARQTGYACIKCHVGGFGPQLTPYGVKFKIAAYTETDHKGRPFANARVGLQYTVYTKYDGASTNYDGTGRNASDNNTLYLFLWLAI
jgi:hypothetical protein